MNSCDLHDCLASLPDLSSPGVVLIALILLIWVLRQLEKD